MSNNFKVGYLAGGVCSVPEDGPGERYNKHRHTSTFVNYKSPACASWDPKCNSSWGIYDGAPLTPEEYERQFGNAFGTKVPATLPGARKLAGACFPAGVSGPPEMGCNPLPTGSSVMMDAAGCLVNGAGVPVVEGFSETMSFPVKLAVFVLLVILIVYILKDQKAI